MDANGAIVVTDTIEQAIDLSNLYAPEHLCLMVQDSERTTWTWSRNAGALFLGDHSPHVLGDYVAGPSHALPYRRRRPLQLRPRRQRFSQVHLHHLSLRGAIDSPLAPRN